MLKDLKGALNSSQGIIAALLLGVTQVSHAATVQPISPVSAWTLFKVLLGLAIVLAAVVFAAYAIRRLQPATWGGAGPLKVLATLPVGARERVVLVQAGSVHMLLGVTATQINTLHVFAEPLNEEALRPTAQAAQFPDWLKKALQGRGAKS